MNKESSDALDKLLSTSDGRMMLGGLTSMGGYASADYNRSLSELKEYFDKEVVECIDDEGQRRYKVIMILSKDKIKAKSWYKRGMFPKINKLDQRISLDEIKMHFEETSKLGLDSVVWLFEALMERHKKELEEKQLKLEMK